MSECMRTRGPALPESLSHTSHPPTPAQDEPRPLRSRPPVPGAGKTPAAVVRPKQSEAHLCFYSAHGAAPITHIFKLTN